MTSRVRKIAGYADMSFTQMDILEYLIAQDDEFGGVWCNLDHFHINALLSLMKADRIISSPRPDGSGKNDYKITLRGRRELEVFKATPPRNWSNSGLCPRCKERPKEPPLHYCKMCDRQRHREYYEKRGRNQYAYRNKGKLCHDCRRKFIAIGTRCRDCYNQREHKIKAQYLERVLAGEEPVPICPLCNERPRAMTQYAISGYCRPCAAEYAVKARKRNLRRKFDKLMGRKRRQARSRG